MVPPGLGPSHLVLGSSASPKSGSEGAAPDSEVMISYRFVQSFVRWLWQFD